MSKEENKAEEKANELIKIYSAVGLQQRDEGVECALICVDKILEANHIIDNKHFPTDKTLDILVEQNEFWQEVKQILTNK